MLWQHNANPSYKLASIQRYDDSANGRLGGVCARRRPAGDGGRPQNRAPHTGSGRGRPAVDGGVLNITAAVWTAGFHWWRSGNKSERKMLASTCLYSLYAWFFFAITTLSLFVFQTCSHYFLLPIWLPSALFQVRRLMSASNTAAPQQTTGSVLAPASSEMSYRSACTLRTTYNMIIQCNAHGLRQVPDIFHTSTVECGPMPNVMADLPNIGGALCSTPQSLADAH